MQLHPDSFFQFKVSGLSALTVHVYVRRAAKASAKHQKAPRAEAQTGERESLEEKQEERADPELAETSVLVQIIRSSSTSSEGEK